MLPWNLAGKPQITFFANPKFEKIILVKSASVPVYFSAASQYHLQCFDQTSSIDFLCIPIGGTKEYIERRHGEPF